MAMRVKNWAEFQHYRDRRPPWIKLYHTLLDNQDFFSLTDRAARYLPLIWLVASETDGVMPSSDIVAFRLRISVDDINNIVAELMGSGFVELVSDAQAADGQRDSLASRYISVGVKKAVRERDKGKCQECGSKANIEFDHIVPVSRGGTGDIDNVQLLCRSCNRRKRSKLPEDWDSAEQPATLDRSNAPQEPVVVRSLETETETETEIEGEIEKEGEGEEPPFEFIEDPTDQRPAVSTKLQQAAFSLYGNVPTMNIGEWLEGHEEAWILAAMRVSESAGKASVAYTAAILRRWKAEGYPAQSELPEDKEHMTKLLARVQEIRDRAKK